MRKRSLYILIDLLQQLVILEERIPSRVGGQAEWVVDFWWCMRLSRVNEQLSLELGE
jgi:hypothetical protein